MKDEMSAPSLPEAARELPARQLASPARVLQGFLLFMQQQRHTLQAACKQEPSSAREQ